MQNNNYQTKHHGGSSTPAREIPKEFRDSGKGLRLNKQALEDSRREDPRRELTGQEFGPGWRFDDEGRWEDDGGKTVQLAKRSR